VWPVAKVSTRSKTGGGKQRFNGGDKQRFNEGRSRDDLLTSKCCHDGHVAGRRGRSMVRGWGLVVMILCPCQIIK